MKKHPSPSDDMSDEEIVAALRGKNRKLQDKALQQLYQDDIIRHTIMKWVGNSSDINSDDILQESIITFCEKVWSGVYDPSKSKVRTYILSIANFLIMRDARKNNRRDNLLEQEQLSNPDNPLLTDQGIDPEELLESKQEREWIHKILAKLGKRCQKVLGLWMLSFSSAEIAMEMRWTESTAKDAVKECKRKLRELF